jgi:hypothetical protein
LTGSIACRTEKSASKSDPRRGLLEGATWQASKLVVCRALNRSLDAETEITGLAQLL